MTRPLLIADPGGGEVAVEVVGAGPYTMSGSWGEPRPTGRRELRLTIRYDGAEPRAGTVRVSRRVPAADPWWLIPGLFYGENRPAACRRVFPRFEAGADRPDEMVSARWGFRADRAATPAVMVWGDEGGVCLIADEESALGATGLAIEHEAGEAAIALLFPYQEFPITYYGSALPRPAEAATHVWQPGETQELTVATCPLPADRHAYAPLLREDRELRLPASPVEPWQEVEEAAGIAAEGLYRWHYDPDPGVLLETVGFDREVSGGDGERVDRQAMHVGWVSGIPWAAALLEHGLRTDRPEHVAAASRVIDFICADLSPSGTFWGTWYRRSGWSQSWSHTKDALHARTLGEATLFLLRALRHRPEPKWEAAARSNLDVMVARQRPDGNLGTLHHAATGEVLSWSGASGLTWIAALCEAGGETYLRAAERAGGYYAAFVEDEFIYGAPEDVDLAPTSEDGYAAVIAYMALHRATGAGRWLDLARRAADWTLTFRYSYNVRFGARTPLGVYGFATRGADQASPSNQHLHAYGLVCTDELIALSEGLGDPYYAERAHETLACFRQLLPAADGEVNAYRGMITERYYQTDCFQPKGMYLTLSHAWSAGVLLLACEQMLARDRARLADHAAR
ncbi:hypothetical protein FE391_36180 [Nonomuraea sp. KC401]|uniref:hypothetical protein n=1 Tax=unclassified Nonomuraea TaxID=2593643 RepID=UPI0010FF5C02|nr:MULTISPECIES: hypothetical protein [unclassified Nonomuraea]NBE99068.1 hypothetical protein [Nonomuraea sp. K271]TLF58585.1 hypothetical protein FE391_36180 [Nonomuraea sp. KC401]